MQRLRRWDDGRISTHYEGCWDSHPVCAILLAADVIERLRAAGDALAEVADEWPELVEAWQEARK